MFRRLRLAIPVLLAAMIIALPGESLAAKIRIKKIMYNPPGADCGTNECLNREWIQIHNAGERAKRIGGWRIRDASGHVFVLSGFRLMPGQDVRVKTGSGDDSFGDPILTYWGSGNYIWDNDGDTATLKNANGKRVDRCSYEGGAPGYKVCS